MPLKTSNIHQVSRPILKQHTKTLSNVIKNHIHQCSVCCSLVNVCWVMSSSWSCLTCKSWGWFEVGPWAPPFFRGGQCPWRPRAPPGPDPAQRTSWVSLRHSDVACPPHFCYLPPAKYQTSPTSSSSLLVLVVCVATWIIHTTHKT